MDWAHVLALSVGLTAAGGLGVGAYFLARQAPEKRDKEIDAVLDQAELDVDAEARAALDRQAARRSTWGAAGAGLGFGVMLPVSWLGPWLDDVSMLSVGGFFVGTVMGRALSALHPVDRPAAGARVSALQPRGWRDYVPTRFLVAQAACGVVGAAAVVFGLAVVIGDGVDVAAEHGRMAIVLGALVCAMTAAATVLQRRLLAAPAVAADESHLVANDVVLATGLRDLVAATVGTGFFCGYVALFALSVSWWWIAVYLAAFLAVTWPISLRLHPALVPVAHRLAARQPVA